MIVVDTNVIAYLYLPNEQTELVEQVLRADREWVAPKLWRSELRNILALYMRRNILDFDTARQIQEQAEKLMRGNEYEIDSLSVLSLARESGCSAYDCEFAALAWALDIPLVTEDNQLRKAFRARAITAAQYLSGA